MIFNFACSAVRSGQALHCHDQIELFMVTTGRGQLQIGRARHSTDPDGIAIVGPQELHAGSPASPDFAVEGLLIEPSAIGKLGFDWEKLIVRGTIVADKRFRHLFTASIRQLALCPSEMSQQELLLALCEQTSIKPNRNSSKHQGVTRAIELLRSRPESNLSLTALARQVDLDPAYLCRAFSRTVGLPPHAFRNRLRVARAVTYLRQGMPASVAALAVGFFDQSHLARHVKSQLGTTPAAIQKKRDPKSQFPPRSPQEFPLP